MPGASNLIGQRFGRLVVEAAVGHRARKRAWRCRCDCGNTTEVITASLTCGDTSSCGCFQREVAAQQARSRSGLRAKHLTEYNIWTTMRQRCQNPKDQRYPDYGERGIGVCERWSDSSGFPRFIADVGPRPTDDHSIDRVDNDGPYSPENCRWSTRQVQARNKRSNRRITIDGVERPLVEWLGEGSVSKSVYQARVVRGWDDVRALTTPVAPHRKDGTGLYTLHRSMRRRCHDPVDHAYRFYGARGIAVSAEWHDYAVFERELIALIGPRPPGATLDRIDNDGPYAPGNVRWASWPEQFSNRQKKDGPKADR